MLPVYLQNPEYIQIPKLAIYETVVPASSEYAPSNGKVGYLEYNKTETQFLYSHDWGIFKEIKRLEVNDEVDISAEYGWREYKVADKEIVNPLVGYTRVAEKGYPVVLFTCIGNNRYLVYLKE